MSTKTHPSASLYVGDLSSEVTEGMLFEIFNPVGPVASIRVCRDTLTRRSLGYAYVNFHSVVDAERALDTLNNTPIRGRPCRIMWSQRDPSIRRSGVGNIFIKNLDRSISHKELYDTFSTYGNILSCKVAMDENGHSRGFGFVHFESQESADNAVKLINQMELVGKTVYVAKFVPKRERLRQKESSWSNIYVKDIDPSVTVEQLKAAFEVYGPTNSVVVMEDENKQPKGFGFVNFVNHEDACKAKDALHGTMLGGKKIWCGPAQKKSERGEELQKKYRQARAEQITKYQGINLYVKNLEDEIDEERLKKEFSVFGSIRSHKIMTTDKLVNRGFGFVCYNTPEEAQRAINEMNGRILQGCSKPLYVALYEPKEIRRQKLAQRHVQRTKGLRPQVPTGMFAPGSQVYYAPNSGIPPTYAVPYAPTGAIVPNRRAFAQPQQSPYAGIPVTAYATAAAAPAPQSASGRGRSNPQARGGAQAAQGGRGARRAQGQPPAQEAVQPEVALDQGIPELNQLPVEQQRMFLGERLYPLVQKFQPQLAPKITGMLLDSGWSVQDLVVLINDEEKLSAKIEEAVSVLEQAQAQATAENPSQ